jgi:hypothetical protein
MGFVIFEKLVDHIKFFYCVFPRTVRKIWGMELREISK